METIEKIRTFQLLCDGWHYGEGVPTTDFSAEVGISILEETEAEGLKAEVFPELNGGLLISLNRPQTDDFLDILVSQKKDSFDVTREKGIGTEYVILWELENINREELTLIIKEFA